jgi:hypothetical protein
VLPNRERDGPPVGGDCRAAKDSRSLTTPQLRVNSIGELPDTLTRASRGNIQKIIWAPWSSGWTGALLRISVGYASNWLHVCVHPDPDYLKPVLNPMGTIATLQFCLADVWGRMGVRPVARHEHFRSGGGGRDAHPKRLARSPRADRISPSGPGRSVGAGARLSELPHLLPDRVYVRQKRRASSQCVQFR